MISRIHLINFRNYDNSVIDFDGGMNLLVGRNGQGKTNILEGIYYLSLLRSFRTSNINEMRQWKSYFFTVSGVVPSSIGPADELMVSYGAERRMLVNNVPVYSASDFVFRFICVTFIPEDLELVQGAPLQRRRFLDIAISQISPDYLHNLQGYAAALKNRNALLKQPDKYDRLTITAYDALLARNGAAIELARCAFVEKLNRCLQSLSDKLIEDSRLLRLKYMFRLRNNLMQEYHLEQAELEAAIREALERNYERDVQNGSTSIGPHRSDFTCILGEAQMGSYASQGECRLGSLSIKLACLDAIREARASNDVTLLVDDVTGELDENRRNRFFNVIKDVGQVVFACTEIPQGFREKAKVMNIEAGTVRY